MIPCECPHCPCLHCLWVVCFSVYAAVHTSCGCPYAPAVLIVRMQEHGVVLPWPSGVEQLGQG